MFVVEGFVFENTLIGDYRDFHIYLIQQIIMKYFLLFLVSVSFSFYSFAQSMTAYEKKYYSLTIQFLKDAGVSETIIKKINNLNDLESVSNNLNYITNIDGKKVL